MQSVQQVCKYGKVNVITKDRAYGKAEGGGAGVMELNTITFNPSAVRSMEAFQISMEVFSKPLLDSHHSSERN